MQTLTGAVLIAAAGIFWLVAMLSPLASIAGVIAFVLGVMGARYFVGGLVRDLSSNQKSLRELVREISSKREDSDREHRKVDVTFKRGG
jgi:hypothetical protein